MRLSAFLTAAALGACATPAKVKEPVSSHAAPVVHELPPGAARLLSGAPVDFTAECQRALTAAQGHLNRLRAMKPTEAPLARMQAYDAATAELGNAAVRSALTANVHPDEAMRRAAEECEQQIEAATAALNLDRGVYDALVSIDVSGDDASTRKWMEKTRREFRRAGVDRDDATRTQVKALHDELVRVGQEFGKNIRDDVRTVKLDPRELAGLPDDYIKAHPAGPDGKVVVTTNYPDYFPMMSYAKSARAREALWRAYRLRGHPANVDVLARLIAKRHELATVLGYPNWAAYDTEDKMTGSEQVAARFIDDVSNAAQARAQADYDELLVRKHRDDPKATRIDPWDQDYLEDQVKAEKFGFDSQALRPYFEYSRVKQGVMDITSRLYGVTFKQVTDAAVWHPDVETYDVLDGNLVIGRIHLDMHPREGKYKHAAQFDLTIGQAGVRGPEGVLVCNFPKSTPDSPGLMQHSEVETFFHEFGHLMHDVFAGHQKWATISGIATERDFVEVPSMLMQEWASDPQTLEVFAKHYQTQAPIPPALVEKLRASREFGKGLYTRRQMFLSATSLELHRRAPGFDPGVLARQLQQKYAPFRFEYVDGTYFHLSFGHLEGYSAAYYTYIWSVVIAKDLLTAFRSHGMLDAAVAKRLRATILEPGGSKDAALLVKDFLGREYSFAAYRDWLNAG